MGTPGFGQEWFPERLACSILGVRRLHRQAAPARRVGTGALPCINRASSSHAGPQCRGQELSQEEGLHGSLGAQVTHS